MKPYAVLFVLSFMAMCEKKKDPLFFYVPGKFKFEQQAVVDISKSHKVYFRQYKGYCFDFNDSLLRRIILVIKSQEMINSDLLSDHSQIELKKEKIKRLKIQYGLKESESKDTIFNRLKELFNGFNVKQTDTTLKFSDFCGNEFVIVNYYETYMPNVLIEIEPISKSCGANNE